MATITSFQELLDALNAQNVRVYFVEPSTTDYPLDRLQPGAIVDGSIERVDTEEIFQTEGREGTGYGEPYYKVVYQMMNPPHRFEGAKSFELLSSAFAFAMKTAGIQPNALTDSFFKL